MTRFHVPLIAGFLALAQLSAHAAGLDLTPLKKWIASQGKIDTIACDFTQERELRTVKRPLKADGRFWFQKPDRFRWELGEPPKSIAIHNGDELTILDVAKKKAEVTDTSGEEAERERFAAYFDLSFPRRWETFEENFDVLALNRVAGEWHAHVKPKSRKTARGIKTMTFFISASSDALLGFSLKVKDGSTITTRFRNIRRNVSVPASRFVVSLDGYKVKS